MSLVRDSVKYKITKEKKIREEQLREEMKNLDEKIKSEKYNIDTMISKSSFGNVYNDIMDSKHNVNSQYHRKFNQAYHSLDVELYKINKKIDSTSREVTYKINNKKDELYNKVITEIM